jgi:hypothetical protein
MTSVLVAQLDHGIQVSCPLTGETITCKPLSLKGARTLIALWEKLSDPEPSVRGVARLALITEFIKTYPDLEANISGGDVETLVPRFFLAASGASTLFPSPSPPSPSTGTPTTAPTSPSGASGPTT